MASNSFGRIFRFTTWGESHGPAIGVVIDGCPAGLEISAAEINAELARRQGGKSPYVTPRKESDEVELLSGVFEGKTTGAPISLLIRNQNVDSSKYEPMRELMRPGHANFTYLEKYGIFDYRGGGRSSARETACRVAAGAIARKFLRAHGIEILAYIREIGGIAIPEPDLSSPVELQKKIDASLIFCPHAQTSDAIMQKLEEVKKAGDSLGGVIEAVAFSVPVGLGDPVYEKLEANLAAAMLSIHATKGFEIGSGFAAARMRGSQHNDTFTVDEKGKICTETNFAGGTLGGISTGMPLIFRTAFKPTSSIQRSQKTVDTQGTEREFKLPEGSRHDPCVTIRAVPIVEAMTALVLADALLTQRCARY